MSEQLEWHTVRNWMQLAHTTLTPGCAGCFNELPDTLLRNFGIDVSDSFQLNILIECLHHNMTQMVAALSNAPNVCGFNPAQKLLLARGITQVWCELMLQLEPLVPQLTTEDVTELPKWQGYKWNVFVPLEVQQQLRAQSVATAPNPALVTSTRDQVVAGMNEAFGGDGTQPFMILVSTLFLIVGGHNHIDHRVLSPEQVLPFRDGFLVELYNALPAHCREFAEAGV